MTVFNRVQSNSFKNKAKEIPWPQVAEFTNIFLSNLSIVLCEVNQVSRVTIHFRSHCEYIAHKEVHQARKYHRKPPSPWMKHQNSHAHLGWQTLFLSHIKIYPNFNFPSSMQITPTWRFGFNFAQQNLWKNWSMNFFYFVDHFKLSRIYYFLSKRKLQRQLITGDEVFQLIF